ncbi:MAG: 23S rRNA (uracil(1939)-C(5))-methyltransferase RlmD [Saccharofermentans sp.]|nr:23S rRNA (uracil(1939)-C(5))-methyltransferase RlmD [Saccharofermentans sp.]
MQQEQSSDKKNKKNCMKAQLCGSCVYMGLSYEEEKKRKQEHFEMLLKDINCVKEPIIGADDPYYYRNKVHAALGKEKGKVISGTYSSGSHRIVPNDDCLIENKAASKIIKDIRALIGEFKLPVYDERTKRGLFRRILIRVAESTGQILVVLVNADTFFPGKKNFVSKLLKKNPDITSLVININKRTDSMILGDKFENCYGRGYIVDELCGLKFKISADSFYQVNHKQTEKLYSEAMAKASLDPNDKVLDAYCGIGTIGMVASKFCGKVIGVEYNKTAVADALDNRRMNNVSNIEFVRGDATEYINKAASSREKFDVVFLDPPRSGTTKEFIRAVSVLGARKVVYISCDPVTLARDLKIFAKEGYKVVSSVPVDMFPWTDALESVTLLQKDESVKDVTLALKRGKYVK